MFLMIIIAITSLGLLAYAVAENIFIGIPLTLLLFSLYFLAKRAGTDNAQLKALSIRGFKRCIPIASVLLLVGALISLWMSSGTVASLIYYGLKVISFDLVIFWGFILSVLVNAEHAITPIMEALCPNWNH